MSTKSRQYATKKIEEVLEQVIFEPATSECASPTVFEQEEGGSFQFCVVPQKLNGINVRDFYLYLLLLRLSTRLVKQPSFRRLAQTPATGKSEPTKKTSRTLRSLADKVSSSSEEFHLGS